MALPKIDLPLMEVKQPSTGEKVKYRPFTVKEEKILLVAQEADDPAAEILAMKQVVNNCFIDLNIDEIPMFDLEYLIMVLRSASVDNKLQFVVTDPDTEERIELELNLDEVKLTNEAEHSKEIKLNDTYTLFLKYPTIDSFVRVAQMGIGEQLTTYYIMTSCLDKVASEDEIEYFKDYSDEEIEDFMNSLSSDVLNKVVRFFETMPKLRHELPYTNKEGKEQTFVVEGARSFFI
jgi:hypothetical protein